MSEKTPPEPEIGTQTMSMAHRVPSLLARLREVALRFPDAVALRAITAEGEVRETSFGRLWNGVSTLAVGLSAVGLVRGDRVLVMGDCAAEILVAELAATACRALSAVVSQRVTAAELRAIAHDCGPRIAIVESGAPLACWLEAMKDAPEKPVVLAFGDGVPGPSGDVRSLVALQADGRRRLERAPRTFEDLVDETRVRDEMAIAYGFGPGGALRGAVLRHEHVIGAPLDHAIGHVAPEESGLVAVPLSGTFVRFTACYGLLLARASIAFAEPGPGAIDALATLEPDLLFAGPDAVDALGARLRAALAASSVPSGGALGRWVHALRERMRGGPRRALVRAARSIVGKKLRLIVAGAGARVDSIALLADAGVQLRRGYGATELTPLAALATEAELDHGAAGRPLAGVSVRVERGEVLVRGGVLAKRYWGAKGAAVIAEDGWFHTGDQGRIDEKGVLWIEDRVDDRVVLAGGAAIAPRAVESAILASPLVAQAALVGTGRPFPIALVVPNVTALRRAAQLRGVKELSARELLCVESLRKIVEDDVVARVAALPLEVRPRAVRVLTMRFTEAGGELTPSRAMRHRAIEEKFARQIAAAYASVGSS